MVSSLMKFRKMLRFVPTGLTVGNALCGFTAILNTMLAYKATPEEIPGIFETSAWLIVCAMLFDMFDGWTARKLNATSEYGMQMDSLADMVTCGVAPATMVAVLVHTNQHLSFNYVIVWVFCCVYVACVALRLALYNVEAAKGEEGKGFSGLPSPGGASALSSLIFVYVYFSRTDADSAFIPIVIKILPFYSCILGFLMVSKVKYWHLGKWLGDVKYNKLKKFLMIIFFLFFSWKSSITTAVFVNVYVLYGLIQYFATMKSRKQVGE